MKLDNHTKALIAVGASIAANCQPCLKNTAGMAQEAGADLEEIALAIEIGRQVRKGAAANMEEYITCLCHETQTQSGVSESSCSCHS